MDSLQTPPSAAGANAGKRERTKLRNRTLILVAAKQVFVEVGYDAATVRDIIHATPLASGTFYNYFKSKEEVYRAVYDEAAQTIRPRLRALRREATTAEQYIASTVYAYLDYIAEEWQHKSIPHYSYIDGENTHLRLDTEEGFAFYRELREDIEDAMTRGVLPKTDSKLLTAAIIGTCLETGGQMLRREDLTPRQTAEFVTAFILSGLKALPPSASQREDAENGPARQAVA